VNVYYDQAVGDVIEATKIVVGIMGRVVRGLRGLRMGTLASGFAPDEDANRVSALAVDEDR